ncbi:hypothetical protein BN2476_1020002 [Paraburkholderia piptadeniae]|uniref:Uncharacterized protein n=1 Tax=Paraburkholderia piptadeniae TaxID=1701573 RepID=A0A1N7SUT6_9BURK|nr:hypothetical protein BN2476_1020002 [Paraburkholderia piptadeniae]
MFPAFFLWPKELLETDLNRKVLASTVQHDLFDGNRDGWKAYVAYMRKKVSWFGTGLPEIQCDALEETAPAAANDASPVEAWNCSVGVRNLDGKYQRTGRADHGHQRKLPAHRTDGRLYVAYQSAHMERESRDALTSCSY